MLTLAKEYEHVCIVVSSQFVIFSQPVTCRAYPQSPYNPVRRHKKRLQQRSRGSRRPRSDLLLESEVVAAREIYKWAWTDARYASTETSQMSRSPLSASRIPYARHAASVQLCKGIEC